MAKNKKKNNNKNQNRNSQSSVNQNKAAQELENTAGELKDAARELEDKAQELKVETQETAQELKAAAAGNIDTLRRLEKEGKKKGRGLEIFGVFAKHNFYANGLTPEELRTTLEDLGPTYVKIGQIMSSRLDLLPESYCKELEKLRQNVQELDPALARAVIEQETGKKIDEIYSEFRDKPLGSASVGQAHYAVLKDGRKVVTDEGAASVHR